MNSPKDTDSGESHENQHDAEAEDAASSGHAHDIPPTPAERTSRRHWIQFRLSTFLIVVTVAGVLLGTWGIRYYRKHRGEQALEVLQSEGGIALKNKDGSVYRVHLQGKAFDDKKLAELAPHLHYLPDLKELDLVETPTSDQGLMHLRRLRQLDDLYVFETNVTPAGIQALQGYLPQLTIKNEKPDPYATGMGLGAVYKHAITIVAIRDDKSQWVTGDGEGVLHWWNDEGRRTRTAKTQAHEDWLFAAAYRPDQRQLATGGGDGKIRFWDVHTRQLQSELDIHSDDVHAIAYAPDGNSVYSASDDHTIRKTPVPPNTHRTTKPQRPHSVLIGEHLATIPCMVLNPSGTIVASGCRDHQISLWDANQGGLIRNLVGHTQDVMSVAFSADGKSLFSCGYDQTVRCWDVDSGKCLYIGVEHTSRVYAVAISPDGRTIASGGHDGLILWEADALAMKRRFPNIKEVSSLRFTGDNELVAADTAGRIRFINLKTGMLNRSYSNSRAALPPSF